MLSQYSILWKTSLYFVHRDSEISLENTGAYYSINIALMSTNTATGGISHMGDTVTSYGSNSPINIAKDHANATINITNYTPPNELTPEYFTSLLDKLSEFLLSQEAEDELKGKDRKTLHDAVETAKNEKDHKKGWSILRKVISVSADIASVLALFLGANPTIPQAVVTALIKS